MKKILLLFLLVCAFQVSKAQIVIPRQEIPYNVNYHWGIIDVMIARGVVTIESDGDIFKGTLDGTSIPWEGRIICVSDTLHARVAPKDGKRNESVIYQNGWYRRPKVSDFRSPRYNPDDPSFYKNTAGQGEYDASKNTMEAITVTADMIGMYYYSHDIDFEKMQPGDKITIPIEGAYSKEVVITYNGQGVYRVNSDIYPTYDCSFEYSYDGNMSGYPVDCKIGVTDKVPLFLSASLPVGKVEMLYDPAISD